MICGRNCNHTPEVNNELINLRVLAIKNTLENDYVTLSRLIRLQKKLKTFLSKQLEIKKQKDNYPKITKLLIMKKMNMIIQKF